MGAPIVGPEVPVDPSVTTTGAWRTQSEPAVASDGTDFLVVWNDDRSGMPLSAEVRGSRVRADGTILDPGGTLVAAYGLSPRVAYGGGYYAVTFYSSVNELVVVRVRPDGTVVDTTPIAVPGSRPGGSGIDVAWNGSHFLLVWVEGQLIKASRMTAAGTVDATPFNVSRNTALYHARPSVSSNGTEWYVAWLGSTSVSFTTQYVYGMRVLASGATASTTDTTVFNTASVIYGTRLDITYGGGVYAVAWTRTATTFYNVAAARIDGSTGVVSQVGNVATGGYFGQAATTFDGTRFRVIWSNPTTSVVNGGSFAVSGSVAADTLPFGSVATGSSFDIAASSSQMLLAWEDFRSTPAGYDVYAARLSTTLTTSEPTGLRVSSGANGQTTPAVAFDGTNYLAVWADNRGTSWDIYGARISAAGAVLGVFAIVNTAASETAPQVAFSPGSYLVTYAVGSSEVRGIRVTTGGALSGSSFIIKSATTILAHALAGGTNGWMVPLNVRGTVPDSVSAVPVTPTGNTGTEVPLDPLASGTGDDGFPAVAWNGTEYLVSYGRREAMSRVRAARVTQAGTPTPSVFDVTSPGQDLNGTAITAVGGTWILAYSRGPGTLARNYARTVAADGTVGSTETMVAIATVTQGPPAIASDGTHAFVTFLDNRSGVNEVYGSFLDGTAAAALDADGFLIASESTTIYRTVVTAGDRGRLLLGMHASTRRRRSRPTASVHDS